MHSISPLYLALSSEPKVAEDYSTVVMVPKPNISLACPLELTVTFDILEPKPCGKIVAVLS